MKKFTLIITIAGMIGLSACSKEYVCTQTENGLTRTITLSDEIGYCFEENGVEECDTFPYGHPDFVAEMTDKESSKDVLEDNGFTCN